MPALNWDVFTGLPGGTEKNFELLCRGIVREALGGYGTFRALANQPGVEFHLKLDRHCAALGDTGRWWGWQCKWYELPPNGALGTTRRTKIKEGLRKTEKHLPDLTDWVLWTRRPLTKDDQNWFNSLDTKMTLHLWTGDEVDNYLAGQAAILRATFFGELVLTPDFLRERHDLAVAPIRARWQPDVHHVGDAEKEIRRMLGEAGAWEAIGALALELRETANAVEASPTATIRLQPLVEGVFAAARQTADNLDRIAEGISAGDLDRLRDELLARQFTLPVEVATAPRRLRAANERAGLYATNAVATCHDAYRVMSAVESGFSSRLVAVLAPAGCGKTHLAAQLTAGTTERPHGILLHGRDLHASHSLDDFASRISIAAKPVRSMEALLAAVDAAGQRAQRRLPVFIDGLNEAEDPRAWKPMLATLATSLKKFPYVLLVCTLRPEFEADALPTGTCRLEIRDYGDGTRDAIRRHFRHWKIDATDADLPGFLSHPLTLRLFCEVTNPARKQVVGIGATPGSLTSLFERYLEQVGVRVVELAPRTHRFYAQDVNAAIVKIADKLWESRSRSIPLGELRNLLGDTLRSWDQSLVRALEHEGVLLRMPSNGSDTFVPVYDLLGGHIIAKAILAKHSQSSFETWATEASASTLLAGNHNSRHPLGDDVLASLVEMLPRRFHSKQLWQLVDQPVRGRALRLAAHLEPAFLDAATVDELLLLARDGDSELLRRAWQVRGTEGHPLNAKGLDRALRPMAVANRDLRWTEWLRANCDDLTSRGRSVLRDLGRLEDGWRAAQLRPGDRLRALWVMWTLTSTVRRVRDQATRALYWFGRVDPEGLFALAVDSMAINDAYVGERVLAAVYGVALGNQRGDVGFAKHLGAFLEKLAAALTGHSATAPTHHYLVRLYARGIVAFASRFYPTTLTTSLREPWAFASPPPVQPLADGDPGADEAGQTLQMDFENYTLGRLFDDRRNYDMKHDGHRAAVAHVRGLVWELGWRAASFGEIDQRIAEDAYRRSRGDQAPTERYGKKYGWIGFFSYAGLLESTGGLVGEAREFSDVDIDPSFPAKPVADGPPSLAAVWLAAAIRSHESWMSASTTEIPASVIRRQTIRKHKGPWIAVHGQVAAGDRVLGRYAWANFSAMVVAKSQQRTLLEALDGGARPWIATDAPSDHYTFAGEIPWHDRFAQVILSEGGYCQDVRAGAETVKVETLAHRYAWESHHSEMNQGGSARVPSKTFSAHFDLRGVAQSFDQFLPNGSQATLTLSGVDGLEGDVLYIREDLLKEYVGERGIVWLAFGERDLRPYPSAPPEWLVDTQRRRANEWQAVLTENDIWSRPRRRKGQRPGSQEAEEPPNTRATRTLSRKPSKGARRKVPMATSKKAAVPARRTGTKKGLPNRRLPPND